uniref:cache domain-containing protein n=1 Tax=Selenomonas ruminantium TaxID=971 RepID=UPI0026EDF0AF
MQRNGILVTQKYMEYLGSTMGFIVSLYLASIVDGILVSQLIGPAAFAGINLTMPVYYARNIVFFLLVDGGSVLAAQYIGAHDKSACNQVFTLTIGGGLVVMAVLGVAGGLLAAPLAAMLAGESSLTELVKAYLIPLWLTSPLLLLANAQDIMLQVAVQNGEGTAISAASKNGFTISVDKDSAARFTSPEAVAPAPFDGTSRPWYKLAERTGKSVFTDVYADSFTGGLRIACTTPYQVNGDFAGVVAMSSYLEGISQLVLNAQAETCFVVDKNGQLLFFKDEVGMLKGHVQPQMDLRTMSNESMAATTAAMTEGKIGTCTVSIDGREFYLAYAPIKQIGWSFAAALNAEDVLATEAKARTDVLAIAKENIEDMDAHMTKVILAMAVVIVLIILFVSWQGRRMGDRFVHPILDLSDGVREIASGNLDKKLDIRTGDEIEHLSVCFNAMTDELQSYMKNLTRITAEKERIVTELNVATNIQESMLPSIFPPFPGCPDIDIRA